MKEMVIIIRPEKLEKVKQIMDHEKLGGISISSVMGCGTQRGVEEDRGSERCAGESAPEDPGADRPGG